MGSSRFTRPPIYAIRARRDARTAESEQAGGGSFHDRVYTAPRPELFFKGNARTEVGSVAEIAIRADAGWHVPEPELVLLADAATIAGSHKERATDPLPARRLLPAVVAK